MSDAALRCYLEAFGHRVIRPKPTFHVFDDLVGLKAPTLVEDPFTGERHYAMNGWTFAEVANAFECRRGIPVTDFVGVIHHEGSESKILLARPVSGFTSLPPGVLPDAVCFNESEFDKVTIRP